MIRILGAILVLSAAPLSAETLIDGGEFQSLSEGRTLYFTQRGSDYGSEQFFEGRRSTWRYADGTCTEGEWFAKGDAICFVYDREPWPQCWIFSRRGGEFYARLDGLAPGDPSELKLSGTDKRPIACNAPDLGV